MDNEIQLISDGDGLAVIGHSADIERFLISQGLDKAPSRDLDLHRFRSVLGSSGAAVQAGSELAANSGRWVKLTAESAKAVQKSGFMPTATRGISHAMIGNRGDIKQWIQIVDKPVAALLGGPMALTVLSTMMQQQAMQQQMDEIVEYLKEINAKVDDILRNQKDAVLADMLGVDLVIEEVVAVRDQVGRVSETTWSKMQATSMTIARTESYALLQLEAIAETLHAKADAGEIAKAAKEAEVKVREWLAVLAHCFRLQDRIWVLELDRVLDASPEELDDHRLGLTAARHKRRELIAGSTARLLTEMDETVRKANSKVLFNPFKSPAAVRSSNLVATDVLKFRGRLGIESGHETADARRWGEAAGELRDRVITTTAEGVDAARRFGADALDQAAVALRPVDTDGDGVPDKSPVMAAAEDAGTAIRGAAADAAGAIGAGAQNAGSAMGELATGAAGAVGSLLKRMQGVPASLNGLDSESAGKDPESRVDGAGDD